MKVAMDTGRIDSSDLDILAKMCWFEGAPTKLRDALFESGFTTKDLVWLDWLSTNPQIKSLHNERVRRGVLGLGFPDSEARAERKNLISDRRPKYLTINQMDTPVQTYVLKYCQLAKRYKNMRVPQVKNGISLELIQRMEPIIYNDKFWNTDVVIAAMEKIPWLIGEEPIHGSDEDYFQCSVEWPFLQRKGQEINFQRILKWANMETKPRWEESEELFQDEPALPEPSALPRPAQPPEFTIPRDFDVIMELLRERVRWAKNEDAYISTRSKMIDVLKKKGMKRITEMHRIISAQQLRYAGASDALAKMIKGDLE